MPFAAALAAALTVSVLSCARRPAAPVPPDRQASAAVAVGGVLQDARRGQGVAEARLSVEVRTIAVGGRLQPRNRVEHEVIADGYILSVDVREGQRGSRGQRLFAIDKDELTGRYRPVVVSSRIDGLVSAVGIREKDEVKAGQSAVTVVGSGGYTLEATVSDKDASPSRWRSAGCRKAVPICARNRP
jgi:multidrug efflux pump subunit AcrA (membrane-fusion protein)